MAQISDERDPEWTGAPRRETAPIELPFPSDFDYEGNRPYQGSADPGQWYADSWPMCTRGRPQRLRHPISYSADSYYSREIELHVPISENERTCAAICLEDRELIQVRVFVCCEAHDWESFRPGEYRLVPMDLYPSEKLRDRLVVDYDTGMGLPLRESMWPSRRGLKEMRASLAERRSTEELPPDDLDIPI